MSQSISDPVIRNTSGNLPISAVLQRHVSRRTVMQGALAAALTAFAGAAPASRASRLMHGQASAPVALGFASLPASMSDACVVPPGYRATMLGAWGTPLTERAAPWRSDGGNSSDDLLYATGMHHDGMHYFPLHGSSSDGLLVVNHEYIDEAALHPNGPTRRNGKRPAEEVRKEINAHGVSVMHIRLQPGAHWNVVPNSRYNRRFTSATPMTLSGPLAGTHWVRTPFSPDGKTVRGTNNNCGNGTTPWGTYLTAEENWAMCFVNRGKMPTHQQRVGVATKAGRYQWESAAGDDSERDGEFARFDVTAYGVDARSDWRNEVNGFGYLVEIDPYDPTSRAVKRTAMGRFAHEAAACGKPVAGQPLAFYSGDDARFEYVYRFVSDAPWDPQDAVPADGKRIAIGHKYLDRGTLYVARFDADGSGQWLPLTPAARTQDGRTLGAVFGSLDAILIHTREAADLLGATPMDRPEWTAVHPEHGDVYLTLTNNNRRSADAGATTGVNAANPRPDNLSGHIVRWHDDPFSDRFDWGVFLFGSPADEDTATNLSGLTVHNQLASPDGIAFDARGILWIQTDNGIDGGRNNAVAKTINDQMLAVVPAALATRTDRSAPAINASNQADLRRFFVGPNEAEITGFAYTPDHCTLFLNIQHPANWPAYGTTDATVAPAGSVRPRSATVAIQKEDGTPVGV